VPGMVPPVVADVVVVAVTCHRTAVVMVMVKERMMIHIRTRFLGPSLSPGRT